MRKIAAVFCFSFLAFSVFAKEKILKEKNYPSWVQNIISPNKNSDWSGLEFGENEVLVKIAEDNGKIIIYSKNDELSYRAVFDKNGNSITNEAYRLSDGSFKFFTEYYEKPPYSLKYSKDEGGECWFDEARILTHSKGNDGLELWYDDARNIIHGKDASDEWWNTYQNGRIIYQKSVIDGETYWDYDQNGNVSSLKVYSHGDYYIHEYKYDLINRVVYEKISQLDENENTGSALTIEMSYDGDDDFVSYVKWTVSDGSNWHLDVNGYEFNNISSNAEYKFEKLNESQMKVIPQNGKHWFIVEKSE